MTDPHVREAQARTDEAAAESEAQDVLYASRYSWLLRQGYDHDDAHPMAMAHAEANTADYLADLQLGPVWED